MAFTVWHCPYTGKGDIHMKKCGQHHAATPAHTLSDLTCGRHDDHMHIEGSITAVSWIPSEAITGMAKLPFGSGVAHYDAPPPHAIGGEGETLDELRAADRFRFANELRARIELDDHGQLISAEYSGGGLIGSTRLSLGKQLSVAAVPLPDKQAEPEVAPDRVRFLQTAGGRTGVPSPRTVARPPYIQYHAPIAWSTLSLTIHFNGRIEGELVGASPFPRHWIYDDGGQLIAKTGLIDFKSWYRNAFGDSTPWGDLDSPALVTEVETALERQLTSSLMRGRKPKIATAQAGSTIAEQGTGGCEMFILLDGVVGVELDGSELCQIGPGAVLGERSTLDGGVRTATLRAVTRCKLAVVQPSDVPLDALQQLAQTHRREDRA